MDTETIAAIVGTLGLVLVALIGGPVMWKLNRIDKKNTEQHGAAAAERHSVAEVVKAELAAAAALQAEKLASIDSQIGKVDGKVDVLGGLVGAHLAYHAHSTPLTAQPGAVIGTLISPKEEAA